MAILLDDVERFLRDHAKHDAGCSSEDCERILLGCRAKARGNGIVTVGAANDLLPEPLRPALRR